MLNVKYKNILFVNPWNREVYPPPSIGYLQSAVKTHFGSEINVQACNIDGLDGMLAKNTFDLVAASFHSFSVKNAIGIRNKVKSAKLICGGHHSSSLPDQMLQIGYDQVVIGEGENAMIDIISGEEGRSINGNYNHFKTIDEIPIPDYSGLGDNWTDGYPIISSRGCPFACNFCASSFFWGRKWHMRNVDNIIIELLLRINNYGMRTWMFEDDNFTLNRKRVIDICSEIIKNGIRMVWQCASRAETLCDEELCTYLFNAGCRVVWLGVESLSQESLDRCGKNTTVAKMLKGIETAERKGIQTMSQFIIGLPGDTINNINETSGNIRKSAIRRTGVNIAWILPNTDIHEKAKAKGFDDSIYLTQGAPFYTYEQNITTLNNWASILKNSK